MKNIEWQDDRDIYGRMLLLTDSFIFNGLRNAIDHYDADFTDALTWGQLKSKRWLLQELHNCNKEDLGTVFLCAGWYAILASMLFEDGFNIDRILSFDIDVDCVPIAETVNKKYAIAGAKQGKHYGETNKDDVEALKKINDFDWLESVYNASDI